MLRVDAAIVGGTGIGDRLAEREGQTLHVPTPFGLLRGRMVEHRGRKILAVQRHAQGHRNPPHKVNYRALAHGLQRLGTKVCVSSAAVGSLREDWAPGTLAVCTDMLDLTGRRLTLFDQQVRHTDFTHPFPASGALSDACKRVGAIAQARAVYVGLDGPRYESPAEIRYLHQAGGDVVGMTASTEAVVMREAGVDYGCLAVVTNLGCGLGHSELNHGEVTNVMQEHGETVLDILLTAVTL